jgi:hypothetical protein
MYNLLPVSPNIGYVEVNVLNYLTQLRFALSVFSVKRRKCPIEEQRKFFSAKETTDYLLHCLCRIRSREARRLKHDIWICNYMVDLREVLEYGDHRIDFISNYNDSRELKKSW